LTPKPSWFTVCPMLPMAPATANVPPVRTTLSLPMTLNARFPMPPRSGPRRRPLSRPCLPTWPGSLWNSRCPPFRCLHYAPVRSLPNMLVALTLGASRRDVAAVRTVRTIVVDHVVRIVRSAVRTDGGPAGPQATAQSGRAHLPAAATALHLHDGMSAPSHPIRLITRPAGSGSSR
jgi:hypothetical protein